MAAGPGVRHAVTMEFAGGNVKSRGMFRTLAAAAVRRVVLASRESAARDWISHPPRGLRETAWVIALVSWCWAAWRWRMAARSGPSRRRGRHRGAGLLRPALGAQAGPARAGRHRRRRVLRRWARRQARRQRRPSSGPAGPRPRAMAGRAVRPGPGLRGRRAGVWLIVRYWICPRKGPAARGAVGPADGAGQRPILILLTDHHPEAGLARRRRRPGPRPARRGLVPAARRGRGHSRAVRTRAARARVRGLTARRFGRLFVRPAAAAPGLRSAPAGTAARSGSPSPGRCR